MTYYTNVGPTSGPFFRREVVDPTIAVLEARDKHLPIGIARCARQSAGGVAFWRLTVNGVKLPGLWIAVDREFRRPRE